ncbi:MAG: peptidase MA family metallohydrolase [Anaerolineae bacterium]
MFGRKRQAHWIFTWVVTLGVLFWFTRAAIRIVQAQGGDAPITAVRNEAIPAFPDEVTFRLEVAADAPITGAVLTIDVEKFSCLEAETQVPVEVEGNTLEWTWVVSRFGNLPPGTTLWWEWTVTDASGRTTTTPRQELTFTDDRFQWRTVTADGVRVHWYRGDDVGPILLDAAVAGLARLQTEMGIELQDEVQFFIYGSSEDMRDAVLYVQNWAGAVAFNEFNVILMGVPPDIAETWGRSTVRHELAHLVVGQFGRSCVGGYRPTWLDEGLAVFAEGELQGDLDEGLQQNSFAPIRSLNGPFPADEGAAGVAYGQSYSVVAFLLEEYGQQKMQELLLTLAQGAGYDEALEQVYGFNVDGLELAWRASIGAPERPIPPTPTPLVAANIPTVAPPGVPRSVPTPPTAVAPSPPAKKPSTGICGLGIIPLLIVGVTAGSKSARRRPSTHE